MREDLCFHAWPGSGKAVARISGRMSKSASHCSRRALLEDQLGQCALYCESLSLPKAKKTDMLRVARKCLPRINVGAAISPRARPGIIS